MIEKDNLLKHLHQVNGGTIRRVGVAHGETSSELWQLLLIQKGDTYFQVQVSQDHEGNGPGHLFIDNITNTNVTDSTTNTNNNPNEDTK